MKRLISLPLLCLTQTGWSMWISKRDYAIQLHVSIASVNRTVQAQFKWHCKWIYVRRNYLAVLYVVLSCLQACTEIVGLDSCGPKQTTAQKTLKNSSVPKLSISIAISKRWGHLSPQPPLPPPIINIFWCVSPAQRCTLSMNNGDVLLPVDAHRARQWACKSRGRWRWRGWGLKWRGRSIHIVFDIINGKLTITAVLECASEQISLQWYTIC